MIAKESNENRIDQLEDELKKIKVQMKYESSLRQNGEIKWASDFANLESKIDQLNQQFAIYENKFEDLDTGVDEKIKDSQAIFDHKCLEMEENFDIIIKNSNEKMQNNILSAQKYIDEKITKSKKESSVQMETIITETVNALMVSVESRVKADFQTKITQLEKLFKS